MKTRIALVAAFLGLATSLSSAVQLAEAKSTVATTASDSQQIVLVMKKQFDRPDVPLSVNPVSIVGSYALAGWIQGKKGGRALLEKVHGQWQISVCGGGGLAQAKVLETTGMGRLLAKDLTSAVALAEAKLSPEQRRLLDSFEGMVKVDGTQGHHGSQAHPHAK